MKRVLIAVITEGDLCVAPFCSSLVESVKAGFGSEIEFFPVFFEAYGNWAMAFNVALTVAWSEKLDGMVCISPRVSWNPQDLVELLDTDKDVVCVPVSTRNGFDMEIGEISRLQVEEETGEIRAQSASLDFIYMASTAIDKMCETHHSVSYRGDEVKLVIQSGDIFESYFDSAAILSYRLREQGFETWVSSRHTAYRQDSMIHRETFEDRLNALRANG